MDLPNILNSKGPAAAVTVEHQLQQHFVLAAQANHRTYSDTGSERGISPHTSDQSSRYSSRSAQPLNSIPNMANGTRFQSPPIPQQPMSMLSNPYISRNGSIENGYGSVLQQNGIQQPEETPPNSARASDGGVTLKAFACTNCGKGFARRSDLARHERIHTGVRPHVCDYPGCSKQFIQRSALTVHARVHTGEKPHMCERCGKPFSDSSSLARHRRIHSGKRPYKCPFADCQKTFTRRTTLTRHQNHHTGTVEEAAAATAAVLASRSAGRTHRTRSEGGSYSDAGSANSTASEVERNDSISPSSEVPQMTLLHRQHSDYYLNAGSLPPHMRGDIQQQQSSRSSPSATSPSLSAFGGGQHRPSLTSHPSIYGPPQPLEPPTHQHEHRQPGSVSGSPHMGTAGWPSPNINGGLGSPNPGQSFIYPEPTYGAPPPHMYYPNSHIRRPQSTEPDQYETKPRLVGGEVWSGGL